ncbi:MAG: guanylate kinase [Planctomycetota bacterium]|nr:MAG: guanylate kinase [Planctomycetota bacterium]
MLIMTASHDSSPAALPGWQSAPALLLVLSGPSGAGKSSIIKGFLQSHANFVMSVSATTRQPRPGETHGTDYFFMSPEAFAQQVERDGFLEHATVFGRHHYGTPRAFVEEHIAHGRSVVMDVDVQGASQIRATMPQAVQVFIAPPSLAELEQRLRGRGTDDEDSITRRLSEAAAEASQWQQFDYIVINHELERAIHDLSAIVRAAGLATHRHHAAP